MLKRLMVLIFFIGGIQLHAQTISYAQVDSVTYDLMMNKDWKQLLKEGNSAEKNKIDFYYLDYRMGMAFYYTKKYRLAQRSFEKAFSFYKYDDGLNASIYHSMLKNEYYDEANRFSKHFSDTLAKQLKTNKFFPVNEIDLGGSTNISDTTIIYDKYFFDAGVNAKIFKGISLYQHYNYMQLPTRDWTYRQHQYYAQINIPLVKYFSVQPAFAFFKGKMDSFTVRSPNGLISNPELNISGWLISLNIKKSFSFVDVSEATTISNLSSVKRFQLNPRVEFFPLFNNYFSFGANYYLLKDTAAVPSKGYDVFLSVSPIKYCRLSLIYYSSMLSTYVDDSSQTIYLGLKNGSMHNGLLINNNNGALLKNFLTVSLDIMPVRKIKLSVFYGIQNKSFHPKLPDGLPELNVNFTYTLFGSSLIFNF